MQNIVNQHLNFRSGAMVGQNPDLQKKAISALKRMKSHSVVTEHHRPPAKPKLNMIFEEYSDDAFKDKMHYDMHVYNYILEDVDQDIADNIQPQISNLYSTIRQIYETLNIKPHTYGCNNLVLESEEQFAENAARITTDYINKTYYTLSPEERDARYKNQVIFEAKEIAISNPDDVNSAVQKAQKQIIYENLLRRVAFPLIIQSNIEEIMESSEDELFDDGKLVNLYEQFNTQLKSVIKTIV